MSHISEQEKEIKTIRPRSISINLSDADVQRISKKTGRVGLSVPELIENFIGDLVGGTYSNGSDERDAAQAWFDRCGFGMFPEKTFLRYLIEWDLLDGFVDLIDDINTAKEELEYAETHKEEYTDADISYWKSDLEESQEEINGIFAEYKDESEDEEIGTLDEEISKVLHWKEEVDNFINA